MFLIAALDCPSVSVFPSSRLLAKALFRLILERFEASPSQHLPVAIMSTSIAIFTTCSSSSRQSYEQSPKAPTSSSSSSFSYSSSPQTPGSTKASQSGHKQKAMHQRRPSLLSDAFCRDKCEHINIGDSDGPVRLISYLSSSQGFVWNPEIFIPSYVDCDYVPLESRREPVHEILLSDEEVKNMLPQ